MTFFDEIFSDAALPVLEEFFGETVAYMPRNGSPRNITVEIDESLQADNDEQGNETATDRLIVIVRRHSTTGISSPQVGDRIRRDKAHDPDQLDYTFEGTGPSKHRDHWMLTFTREQRTATGRE